MGSRYSDLAMPKRPSMVSLSEVLEDTLRGLGLQKALLQARILKHWDAAVGPAIAAHAQPEELRSNRLTVRVDSSAWLQELTLLKPSLVEKLNAVLGKDVVGEMVLRLGPQEGNPKGSLGWPRGASRDS